jgi:hypothetical protein
MFDDLPVAAVLGLIDRIEAGFIQLLLVQTFDNKYS